MSYTLAEIDINLKLWRECSEAVARNLSYTVGDVTYTRSNAAQIPNMISFWEGQRQKLLNKRRPRARRVF